MRLIQEERGLTAATHVYEPDSYVPLARIDLSPDLGAKARTPDEPALAARVYYLHTSINGAPEEMTDARGTLVWQARYAVWGNTVAEHWHREHRPDPSGLSAQSPLPQNLRMQGQYADPETGLCYNTFRYYDPDIGRFISQDPIGLAGGMNLYQYAPNPIRWIDPWGLSSCLGTPIKRNTARQLLRSRGQSKQQQHEVVNSFEGQIYASQGKAGEQFMVTETTPGSASGVFVTRSSAGITPAERQAKLALPPSNTAEIENKVALTRDQTLLEGKVAPQLQWGGDRTGGGWQVVTAGGKYTGAIGR